MNTIKINKIYSVERPDSNNYKVVKTVKGVAKKGKYKGKVVVSKTHHYYSKLEQALNHILTNSASEEAKSLQEVLKNIQLAKNEILQACMKLKK